jgi:hypothetical protein
MFRFIEPPFPWQRLSIRRQVGATAAWRVVSRYGALMKMKSNYTAASAFTADAIPNRRTNGRPWLQKNLAFPEANQLARVHADHPSDHLDTPLDRSVSHLALQHGLGILSRGRNRSRAPDLDYSRAMEPNIDAHPDGGS